MLVSYAKERFLEAAKFLFHTVPKNCLNSTIPWSYQYVGLVPHSRVYDHLHVCAIDGHDAHTKFR
jgi:hypothetical protein